MDKEPEIWADVVGYEGLYEASNWGKIRSLRKQFYGRIIKQATTKQGYKQVVLTDIDKCRHNILVHRMIALVFINNPLNLPMVNHKNNIKNDNYVGNLEWCTDSYNKKHAFSIGAKSTSCEDHPQNKYNKEQIRQIYILAIKGEHSFPQIAAMCNTNRSVVNSVKNKQTWSKFTDEIDKELKLIV